MLNRLGASTECAVNRPLYLASWCVGIVLMGSACVDCGGLPGDDAGSPDAVSDAGLRFDGGAEQTNDGGALLDAGQTDGGVGSPCAAYCDQLMESCVDANQQFSTHDECLAYCDEAGAWSGTAEDDAMGNHVECRVEELTRETTDLSSRCDRAGPTGGGVCGSLCGNYCDAIMSNCTEENAAFESVDVCLATCSNYLHDDESQPYLTEGMGADNYACRLWHGALPALEDPQNACPAASASGGQHCRSPDPVASCDAYCDLMDRHCYGASAQYASSQSCLQYCTVVADFASVDAGTADANSLTCRVYYANDPSLDDPSVGCVAAGPSGGGTCGTWCENYCDLAENNCTGENALYSDRAQCLTACAVFSEAGNSGDLTGDTVQCRIHLLGGPAYADPTTYCLEGSATNSTFCVNTQGTDGGTSDAGASDAGTGAVTCASYCSQVMSVCAGVYAQYETFDSCLTQCAEVARWPEGSVSAASENTIGCRMHYAIEEASEKPELYCASAGFSGDTNCGSWCDNYCDLVAQTCFADDVLYSDNEECQSACANFSQDGEIGDDEGDNVQCRLTQALQAGLSDDRGPFCDAAGASSHGSCTNQNCSFYCAQMQDECPATALDVQTCEEECTALRQTGYPSATGGNTLQCRIAQIAEATAVDDVAACSAASIESTAGTCIDDCTYYCNVTEEACSNGIHDLTWSSTCEDACANYVLGEPETLLADTFYCRLDKAERALVDPSLYCPHAGEDSDMLCIDPSSTDGGVAMDGGLMDGGPFIDGGDTMDGGLPTEAVDGGHPSMMNTDGGTHVPDSIDGGIDGGNEEPSLDGGNHVMPPADDGGAPSGEDDAGEALPESADGGAMETSPDSGS